jgi:hypothetical protein
VRIPLPGALEDAARLLSRLGQKKRVDELITAMNRAAEAAVPEARQMLIDTARKISVDDALGIVRGGTTSVTDFFARKTREPLGVKFLPIVTRATEKVKLADRYNAFAAKAATLGLVKGDRRQPAAARHRQGAGRAVPDDRRGREAHSRRPAEDRQRDPEEGVRGLNQASRAGTPNSASRTWARPQRLACQQGLIGGLQQGITRPVGPRRVTHTGRKAQAGDRAAGGVDAFGLPERQQLFELVPRSCGLGLRHQQAELLAAPAAQPRRFAAPGPAAARRRRPARGRRRRGRGDR